MSRLRAVGLPILAVLEDSSTDAIYLGRVLIISIFALCPILIILGPKIYAIVRTKYVRASSTSSARGVEQSSSSHSKKSTRGSLLVGERVRVSGLNAPPSSNV